MIPHDKALHIVVGACIFALVHFAGIYLAIGAVLTAAIGKELFDWWSGRGTPELMDVVATVAGGGIGLLCAL